MAKGYWIGHTSIKDPKKYKDYQSANAEAFSKYGGQFIVRGGDFECVAGSARERHVVIEFDSYEKALECHASPEYQSARKLRDSYSENDVIIVKGV